MKTMGSLVLALCLFVSALTGFAGAASADAANVPLSFPEQVANEDISIAGGILKVALPSYTPFPNQFNPLYTAVELDFQVTEWVNESLLGMEKGYMYDQSGAATYVVNVPEKTITLALRAGVTWHDGQPVTLDDLVFAYEVIAHPDYNGDYYSDRVYQVEGVEAYHRGEADAISGLVLSPDKMTLVMHFAYMSPVVVAGGLWVEPLPRHYFEGVAVRDMGDDEKSRTAPIGFGPFKVKSVVPGEAVELERFDDYWRGTPKLDGVSLSLINPDILPAALENGAFDVARFPRQTYADHQNPTNYQYLANDSGYFQFTGFKLGRFDYEKGEVVVNPDAKMADISLRRAIGYAVNFDEIATQLYSGLGSRLATPILHIHEDYINHDVAGYPYDPEKAKQLLEEAGYRDVDGDGFREDKSGQPLVIIWGVPNTLPEIDTQYRIQSWADVGLQVVLFGGQQAEVGAYYDALFTDSADIDMFEVGMTVVSDPQVKAFWGKFSPMNLPRYTDDEMERLIGRLYADEAWDAAVLRQAYADWQAYYAAVSPAITTLSYKRLLAVNNRVKHFTIVDQVIARAYHLVELTADSPHQK